MKVPAKVKEPRTIYLHARFSPDELDAVGRLRFATFFSDALSHARQLKHPRKLTKGHSRAYDEGIAVVDQLKCLADAAVAGDAAAAKTLTEIATYATGLVLLIEKAQPELMQGIARLQANWPVLADDEAEGNTRTRRRLDTLGLAADLGWFKARFRVARGSDSNLPARLWAKRAVRSIEETRFRYLCYAQVIRAFERDEALAEFCLEAGWEFSKDPGWIMDIVKLETFSKDSLSAWKRAIRKMIREQVPEFHDRPEWATQRNSAIERGRGTPGEIQNAILDDICSALERIAPAKEMPKSAS